MVAYRETAMRHGDKWLARKKIWINQELRKGKGDARELEGKLAILLEVKGQRDAIVRKAGKAVEELERERKRLAGRKKEIEKEIEESEPMRRKGEVEGQLEEIGKRIGKAAAAAAMLAGIGKNGLAATREMRDFWERQMG